MRCYTSLEPVLYQVVSKQCKLYFPADTTEQAFIDNVDAKDVYTVGISLMATESKPMREQHGPVMEDQSLARFGNYDLVRRIDVGGMGEVYLAHQLSAFGRVVAIKIIRSDLVHDMTARARFLREAEVSAHLKHDHILHF